MMMMMMVVMTISAIAGPVHTSKESEHVREGIEIIKPFHTTDIRLSVSDFQFIS
jgi:hypothetical protein